MNLNEFYKLICKEFNNGEPLEYKYTDKSGYWKMTKGFTGHGMKEMSAGQWLRIMKEARESMAEQHEKDKRSRGRPTKKVRNKYVGDLYE